MNVATTRATLWSAAGAMLVGAVVALAVLLSPVPAPDVTATTSGGGGAPASADDGAAVEPLPPLESYEPILVHVFHEPLEAPSPAQVEVVRHEAAPQDRPVPLELLGTVGDSLALLQTPDGTTEVVGLGESLEGAEVIGIDAGRVTIRFDEREQVLERVPDEPPVGSITGS